MKVWIMIAIAILMPNALYSSTSSSTAGQGIPKDDKVESAVTGAVLWPPNAADSGAQKETNK